MFHQNYHYENTQPSFNYVLDQFLSVYTYITQITCKHFIPGLE